MLELHRASRGDWLLDGLAELLRTPAGDPLVPEVVAVPTAGVERWLTQRLSSVLGASAGGEDGVCANVVFPFPGSLVGQAVARATGVDPKLDPWRPERAVWPLLEVVDAHLEAGWLDTLAAHFGAGDGGGSTRAARRYPTVRHIADLFDSYGVHRPELVRAWAEGDDGDVPDDLAWQPELWRHLRLRIGLPSPAERLPAACAALARDAGLVDWPGRCSIFGLTRLPASYLEVLGAVARHRDIHLWLLHPSSALWAGASVGAGHPVLATWGRDAREMQGVLAAAGAGDGSFLPDGAHPATLLGQVQADIRANREPGLQTHPVLDPADTSLQVHACHGRARQVEVLRDAIRHLLADDPTLEPRDVIVLCPDIDAFAPFIQATFGGGGDLAGSSAEEGPGELHVRLADRSIRQTNPVLGALSQLFDLAASRVGASQVLDWAGTEPVRRRFGFDEDDLARLERWVRAAGVRWGLDPEDRGRYGLASVPDGTWAAGLDRLLLGVAMSEDGLPLVGGVLPLDDVDSGDIELAGRVAELLARLAATLRRFAGRWPAAEWVQLIETAADQLMDVAGGDQWQRDQLAAILDDVRAEGGPSGPVLSLGEVRALLADRLRGQPTRANFRTGHLTMCTLVPMRSVPHRVVCLLGLDDGYFPRQTLPDGDDLLARQPQPGDRDPRSEDRQLLLDAVLAARDCVVITYTGRDERTNVARPPAVPVGELLDVIDQTVTAPAWARPRLAVVAHHPLQPYDRRNFVAGTLRVGQAWSFDRVALAGAVAASGSRSASPGMVGTALAPPRPSDLLRLDDLVRFVQQPVRAFLQQRLRVSLPREDRDADDALPIELDGLAKWVVGDRLLAARLDGGDLASCQAAEQARGALPPGQFGLGVLDEVSVVVERLCQAADRAGAVRPARPGGLDPATSSAVDVAYSLADGRDLVGTVADLYGDQLLVVTYSRLAPKHRLAAWVRLLALTASDPSRPWSAHSIGRGHDPEVATATVGPLGASPGQRAEVAGRQLSTLVDLYDRGMCEALPLSVQASWAWVEAGLRLKDPEAAARGEWESQYGFDKEDREAAHQMAFAGPVALASLLAHPRRDDEAGAGWDPLEATRFGALAHRLWDGVLAWEKRS